MERVLLFVGGALLGSIATMIVMFESQRDDLQVIFSLPESTFIENPGDFHNIGPQYPWINWLRSRTHFNAEGVVIVGYDALLAAVEEVDAVLGELHALQEEDNVDIE